ncbi:ABC transporter substrate-binding protein [Antrihabitans cavernicola]|uniref:ABC transporter substrate-binding protein n=1 Tax=Antrihabitans cavernicola TaxID=2495913 RepID=A0A5A7S1H5_9NOCA|nr:ABC transporter substrate-binding protein [Spelaeibacter cavernicola]KAA0017099.1 ABC transporter substrate-binding protein [Spelaeibacter cavernicola]
MLVACGGADGDAAAAGPAQPGGTLRYGLSVAPTCADPAQSGTNQTIYVTRQIVDSLTDQDPKTGEIKPWLAQSWQVAPDASSFTFTLKDGVTFSDGTPVTADSVKKNFDAVKDLGPDGALAKSYLSGYTGTDVIDAHTARVNFSGPNVAFLQASSTPQLGVLSDATVAQPWEQRCQGNAIGSGPFVYTDWQQGRSATLKKRAGYDWGSAVFAHRGDAYLDGIDFTVVPESGVRAGSVSSGQLDATSDALPQDASQIQGAGGQVLTRPNPGIVFFFQPNVTRGVLADQAVRQALIPAIDRKELIDTVLDPTFFAATGPLAHTTPLYKDLSSTVKYDPAKAGKDLDAAGWRTGTDGIREKNGQRLSFAVSFTAVFAGNQAVLELVQQQLKKVGVDLQLQLLSNGDYNARTASGDYDALYYNSTRADPDILRATFATDGRNFNRRGPDPELDQALTGQLASADVNQRGAQVSKAQELIIDRGLSIPTIELSQAIGVASTVQDLKFEASSRLQFYDAWLSGRS